MKISRGYFSVVLASVFALGAVCSFTLFGYFKAVEHSSGSQGSERRIGDTLKLMHSSLQSAEKAEDAKTRMKAFETVIANGPDSGAVEKLRRAYGPVMGVFAEKPREADARFQISKKRELMDALVNAYRKEIPNGDIRLRAAYLNILFDTQASLLDEDDKTEQVYIRRNKERFAALHALAAAGDAALQARVGNIESIFQAMDNSVELTVKWKEQKADALAAVEKALPKLAREMHGNKDEDLDGARRDFLYTAVGAACVFLASLLMIAIMHKVSQLRSSARASALLNYLREFGQERTDPKVSKEIQSLKDDRDWAHVIHGALEAESSFVSKYQSLIAVPKSLRVPFVVFSRDKVAQHWNDEAAALLGFKAGQAVAFDEIISDDHFAAREGDSEGLKEMIRNSFAALKADAFEGKIKQGEGWLPVEILTGPVTSGPLAGGKVYLFREIRNEAERMDQAVGTHLEQLRQYVQKISLGASPASLADVSTHPEVKLALEDLGSMKHRSDERESLWKSETAALMDQVVREREVLERLSDEIRQMREAQGNALGLVGTIHGSDEHWHDEVCALERDMDRWKDARRRLEVEIGSQQTVVTKARLYEEEVRKAAEAMQGFLGNYEAVLAQLAQFSDEAKVHSVNMSFVQDPQYREFAARSRAYAQEIGRFVEHAEDLAAQVKVFVEKHPGRSLAPHLHTNEIDASLFSSLKTEEDRLATFLSRWRESGTSLVSEGEKALEILRAADKQAAVATQLGDTVMLINAQAKGNLERWN